MANFLTIIYQLLLIGLSKLYLLIIYLWYKRQKSASPWSNDNLFIISCGNIIAGGSGKTPLTEYLIKILLPNPVSKLALLSHGYKKQHSHDMLIQPGQKIRSWQLYGDEAVQLHNLFPNIPIYIAKNRFNVVQAIYQKFNTLIIDDGYQQWRFKKQLNLLLFDATTPIDYLKMIPAGRLREPLSAINRADAIIFTKVNLASESFNTLQNVISKYALHIPKFYLDYKLESIKSLNGQELKAETLHNQNIIALSAIAQPSSFKKTLQELGINNVVKHYIFNDHHPFTKKDIQPIIKQQLPVITTEKDAVRLQPFQKMFTKVYYLKMAFQENKEFETFVNTKIKKYFLSKN